MKTRPNGHAEHLPILDDHKLPYTSSILLVVLMTATSAAGLSFPDSIYPTDELLQSYLATDIVNLVIGLPSLLSSLWLTWRGKLVGLLLWPGGLLYVFYNYIAYIFGIRFSTYTLAFVALVMLSAYSIIDLIRNIDGNAVQARLKGAVSERLSGGVLILFGVAFSLRAVSMIVSAIVDQHMLPISEIGVLIADLILSVLWISGGLTLLRRMPLGYTSGLGLLFGGCTLFIGLIILLLLQPILTEVPFALTDVVVVVVMSLVCFIPFGLYLRGVLQHK